MPKETPQPRQPEPSPHHDSPGRGEPTPKRFPEHIEPSRPWPRPTPPPPKE